MNPVWQQLMTQSMCGCSIWLWRSHWLYFSGNTCPMNGNFFCACLVTLQCDLRWFGGQALLFIWHHYTTLYILCCGVDLIKWNCLFHQSPEDTLMFSPDWTGHQTYFVSLRPPSAAASSNFRQMCSNLSFQDIFSLEKSPSFTARQYVYMYSFFLT